VRPSTVQEELKGGEIHDFLAEHDHFTEGQARSVAKQVLEGLEYLALNG